MPEDEAEFEELFKNILAAHDKPFEWRGDLSYFELAIASIDGAIMSNRTRPLGLGEAINHTIAHARHEHHIDYFIRHYPDSCNEAGIIEACQTLDISPEVAKFAASLAQARIRNRKCPS